MRNDIGFQENWSVGEGVLIVTFGLTLLYYSFRVGMIIVRVRRSGQVWQIVTKGYSERFVMYRLLLLNGVLFLIVLWVFGLGPPFFLW